MQRIQDLDFHYDLQTASEEASRCIGCKVPNCVRACPLNINVPLINKYVESLDIASAYKELSKKNPLAEISCDICAARNICVGACALGKKETKEKVRAKEKHGMNFPKIEDFICRYIKDFNNENEIIRESTSKKVAILGSGYAALSSAFILSKNGFKVTIFDSNEFFLELKNSLPDSAKVKAIIADYKAELENLSVSFEKLERGSSDSDLSRLRRDFDFLILTTNIELKREVSIPGETNCLIHPLNSKMQLFTYAKDFIISPEKENFFKADDRVIVVGCGAEAFDSARLAYKFSKNVELFCECDESHVVLRKDELERNKTKNIIFHYYSKPTKIVIRDKKIVVTFIKTEIKKDENLKNQIELCFDTEWEEECDHIIVDSENKSMALEDILNLKGVEFNKDLTIKVDKKFQANSDGSIFACSEVAGFKGDILERISSGGKIASSIVNDSGGNISEFASELNEMLRKQSMEERRLGLDNISSVDDDFDDEDL